MNDKNPEHLSYAGASTNYEGAGDEPQKLHSVPVEEVGDQDELIARGTKSSPDEDASDDEDPSND
jgi:hypothetical protein